MHTRGGTVSERKFGFHPSTDSLDFRTPDLFPVIVLGYGISPHVTLPRK